MPRTTCTASVTGNHVAPAFTVFQTPPLSVPAYAMPGRPSTPDTESTFPPMNGPMLRHCRSWNRVGLICAWAGPTMNSAVLATTVHANPLARFDITEIKAHPQRYRLSLHIPG